MFLYKAVSVYCVNGSFLIGMTINITINLKSMVRSCLATGMLSEEKQIANYLASNIARFA